MFSATGPLVQQLPAERYSLHLLLQLVQLIVTIKNSKAEGFHPSITLYFFRAVVNFFTETLIHLKDLYFVP